MNYESLLTDLLICFLFVCFFRKIVEPETPSVEMNRLRREVIESVFQPGYRPTPKQLDGWLKHSATLGNKVNMTGGDPRRWNYKQVASFVNSIVPGLSKPFIDQVT